MPLCFFIYTLETNDHQYSLKPAFFKISCYVLQKKKVIQVWNLNSIGKLVWVFKASCAARRPHSQSVICIQVFGVNSGSTVCYFRHGASTQQQLWCGKLEHSFATSQILFQLLYLSPFPQSDLTLKPLCHHRLPSCCRHGNINLISPPSDASYF